MPSGATADIDNGSSRWANRSDGTGRPAGRLVTELFGAQRRDSLDTTAAVRTATDGGSAARWWFVATAIGDPMISGPGWLRRTTTPG